MPDGRSTPANRERRDLLVEAHEEIERLRRCGLCGGYGALNEVTRKPVPCMACGKESEGMVLVAVDVLDQAEPGDQRGGLRVIKGGRDA